MWGEGGTCNERNEKVKGKKKKEKSKIEMLGMRGKKCYNLRELSVKGKNMVRKCEWRKFLEGESKANDEMKVKKENDENKIIKKQNKKKHEIIL